MTKVAVLGCGPAGLMATHAALVAGAEDVRILSKARKSHLYGAQYLHGPIPGATSTAPVLVRYEMRGTAESYRQKVYGGNLWNGSVSPEDYGETHMAWDIRTTYDWLWNVYEPFIIETDLSKPGEVERALDHFDIVISSVPRPVLCRVNLCSFESASIWAMGDAPDRGQYVPHACPRNTVILNSSDEPRWYRISNIFGYKTVEWPGPTRPPFSGVVEVRKPLRHNCTCWQQIVHVGRYGQWEKGVLTHHAYQKVFDLFMEKEKVH